MLMEASSIMVTLKRLLLLTSVATLLGPLACAQPGEDEAPDPELQALLQLEWDSRHTAPQVTSTITGVVVDEQGHPVPGAGVVIRTGDRDEPRLIVLSDQQGHFTYAPRSEVSELWIAPQEPYFAGGPERHGGIRVSIPVETAELPLTIPAYVPRSLSGVVVNEGGAPVADVQVTLVREYIVGHTEPVQGHSDQDLMITTTDGDGRFRLEGLRPGWVSLMLDHPDYARTFSPDDQRQETDREDARLVIRRGLELKGRVVTRGTPVGGVLVELRQSELSRRSLGRWDVVTDDEGRFRIVGVSDYMRRNGYFITRVTATVRSEEWASHRYSVYEASLGQLPFVEIEAFPRGEDGPEERLIHVGKPMPGSIARMVGDPWGSSQVVVSFDEAFGDDELHRGEVWLEPASDDGAPWHRTLSIETRREVVFDQIPEGTYTLHFLHVRNVLGGGLIKSVEVGRDQTARVFVARWPNRLVDMPPGTTRVHGAITCASERVTAGSVTFLPLRIESGKYTGFFHAPVGADGTYERLGVPHGRYELIFADGHGHSVPNRRQVDIHSQVVRCDFDLPQTRIDVVLPDGRVPAFDEEGWGTVLSVHPSGTAPYGGNTGGLIQPDEDGYYAEHLPPGRWTLHMRDPETGKTLLAHVDLEGSAARVLTTLREAEDMGSGVIVGKIEGWDPEAEHDPKRDEAPFRILAYPKDQHGLDVVRSIGRARISSEHRAYRIDGLMPGTYGIFIEPRFPRGVGPVSVEQREQLGSSAIPFTYVPDIVVTGDQPTRCHVRLAESRFVEIELTDETWAPVYNTWSLRLGGEDWLPFSHFIGSSPLANATGPLPIPLPIGEHELLADFGDPKAQTHCLRVGPGEGVQEVVIRRR